MSKFEICTTSFELTNNSKEQRGFLRYFDVLSPLSQFTQLNLTFTKQKWLASKKNTNKFTFDVQIMLDNKSANPKMHKVRFHKKFII